MSQKISLKFTDGRDNPAFGIPSTELNSAFGSVHEESLGRWQESLKFFGINTVTKEQTHKMVTLKGSPFSLVGHQACVWDPNKTVLSAKSEVTPVPHDIQEEYCMNTDFDGAFAILEEYRNTGTTGTEPAQRLVVREISSSVGEGARLQSILGSVYDTLPAAAGTEPSLAAAWLKGRATQVGLVRAMVDSAANDPANFLHLNQDVWPAALTSANQLDGNIEVQLEQILTGAKSQLQNASNLGALYAKNQEFKVCIYTSPLVFNSVVRRYLETNALTAQNKQAITRERADGIMTYFYNEMPVLVDPIFASVDEMVGRLTAFAAITPASNIGIGSSFTNQRAVFKPQDEIGLVVEYGAGIEDAGKLKVRGKMLVSSSIADTNLIAGAFKSYTPA